jgi:hypothetical protein
MTVLALASPFEGFLVAVHFADILDILERIELICCNFLVHRAQSRQAIQMMHIRAILAPSPFADLVVQIDLNSVYLDVLELLQLLRELSHFHRVPDLLPLHLIEVPFGFKNLYIFIDVSVQLVCEADQNILFDIAVP